MTLPDGIQSKFGEWLKSSSTRSIQQPMAAAADLVKKNSTELFFK